MSLKKILNSSIDLILENLYSAQSIYNTPIDYLDYIENHKYENFKYTDEDWQIIAQEKNQLEVIKLITKEAMGIAERLKIRTDKIKIKESVKVKIIKDKRFFF